jgi:hypothetical protein
MPATPQGLPDLLYSVAPASVIASYDYTGRGLLAPETFDRASTILGDEFTLDGRDEDLRERFLEGVTAPANPSDGTRTNFFSSAGISLSNLLAGPERFKRRCDTRHRLEKRADDPLFSPHCCSYSPFSDPLVRQAQGAIPAIPAATARQTSQGLPVAAHLLDGLLELAVGRGEQGSPTSLCL